MTPTTVARLPLHQIASQQQDAIIFDVNSIASLGNDTIFLILYLSKEDEHNGYGTVIQVDPQTKQVAIYADLNPEYTYLFYKNEQGQLNTLLWCVEVATQTSDGLFIAHAKSYGRGISAEDLKRFNQVDLPDNQPQAQHTLAESYTPSTPVANTTQPNYANTQIASAQQVAAPNMPAMPASSTPAAANPTSAMPTTMPASLVNSVNNFAQTQSAPASTTTTLPNPIANPIQPVASPPPASVTNPGATTMPTPATSVSPVQPAIEQSVQAAPTAPLNQIFSESEPVAPTFIPTTPSPANDAEPLSFADQEPEESSEAYSELNLPPLGTQPTSPNTQQAAPAQPAPMPVDILQPIMPPSAAPASASQTQTASRQPVGRPPKPLLQDQLWSVSPEDFIWVKNMSRQPIAEFKEVLHQKVVQQVRTYKPGLMEDWQFTGMFEQAFIALCTTYELIPALRHDILKALLNGRVVENIRKTQQGSISPASTL